MKRDFDVAWSCVVDDRPAIWSSIVPWLATLTELAGADPSHIHIHHVCTLPAAYADLFQALRVNTHATQLFHPRYPHANKIQQCATDFDGVSHVVLTDVDVAVAGRPPFADIRAAVAGKLADKPNPSIERLRTIFDAAGIDLPRVCSSTYVDAECATVEFDTLPGNFNGGLYVLQRPHLGRIGKAWSRWARWLTDNIGLLEQRAHDLKRRGKNLGRRGKNLDQVSFCLAVNDLGLDVDLLGDCWNFPMHLNTADQGTEPFILHHHALFNDRRHLEQPSAPWLQDAVTRVNQAIETFRRKHGLP